MTISPIRLLSTRIKASGTLTLAHGASQDYPGEDAKSYRRQFVITNLDATNPLKLCATNYGTNIAWCTVWPQTSITLETSADVRVYNPHGADSVDYEVGELFYDEQPPGAGYTLTPGGVTVASAGGGSSGSSGGSTSSPSYYSGGTGGTASRRSEA